MFLCCLNSEPVDGIFWPLSFVGRLSKSSIEIYEVFDQEDRVRSTVHSQSRDTKIDLNWA